MNIFPLFKAGSDDLDGDLSEIIGFQAVNSKGVVLGRGESEEEARENALIAMYLAESNEDSPRKIKLDPKLFKKRVPQGH
jgi:hypothetical protein